MKKGDASLAERFAAALDAFQKSVEPLKGLHRPQCRQSFVMQLIESVRRVQFIRTLARTRRTPGCADPKNPGFSPIRAAAFSLQNGCLDEACWFVFFAVHFGKNKERGWLLARQVYGALGAGTWNWATISKNPEAFRSWLGANRTRLTSGGFGNHRKYISLDPASHAGTAAAVHSYVSWVLGAGGHATLFNTALSQCHHNARQAFRFLSSTMPVVSFGRTGIFDYLAMIGNLGIATIEPDSAYMNGATGPYAGARLLFLGEKTATLSRSEADEKLIRLESYLQVGMQVMEDAVCNWQKSPNTFVPFRA